MSRVVSNDISNASHKIALLFVLLAAIACAFWVVSSKSTVRLGRQIELQHSGFSISLPAAEEWESKTEKWVFSQEHNYFYTGAIKRQKGLTTTTVQWRYIISPQRGNASDILSQRADRNNAEIIDKRTQLLDGFGAHTAYMRTRHGEHIFLALAVLENGRTAELEVRGRKHYQSQDIFSAMLKGARFENNNLLSAGRELIGSITAYSAARRGIIEPLEHLYLLESDGMLDGFSGLRWYPGKTGDYVKSVTYVNFNDRDIERTNIFFRTLDGRISWRFDQKSPFARTDETILIEVVPGEALIISNLVNDTRRVLPDSDTLWPELLDFRLFEAFIDSNIEKCVVDILQPHGQVLPMKMKKTHLGNNEWKISLNYLHVPELDLKVEIGDNKMVKGRIFDEKTRHRLYLSQREDIIARYPRQSILLRKLSD